MKKSIKLITATATAMVLAGTLTPSVVSANASVNVSANSNNTDRDQDLSVFDQFISVRNNRFVLSDVSLKNMSNSDVIAVKEALNQSNQFVEQHNATINPETKEIDTHLLSVSGLSTKWFWWGERYYFTSNAAVAYVSHRMRSQGDALAGLGILGTILSSGTAAVIGGTAALYFNNVANNLDYYNSIHIHSHIYMDMNYSGYYSLHTF